jgi:hypothetical protein
MLASGDTEVTIGEIGRAMLDATVATRGFWCPPDRRSGDGELPYPNGTPCVTKRHGSPHLCIGVTKPHHSDSPGRTQTLWSLSHY